MAAFCPWFTGTTGAWPFEDPSPTTTSATNATAALYSQDLPNHPHSYLNTTNTSTTHQDYTNINYFLNDNHYSCTDPHRLIIPPYNPTLILPPPPPPPAAAFGGEEAEKKRKMYHNASERDRRKKINSLYSSLRDVLPTATDRMKRLSNPDTVARAVKYIPELQNKVHLLSQQKHNLLLLSNTTTAAPASLSSSSNYSSYSVQATQLGNGEVLVQISTPKSVRSIIPISEFMRELEEEEEIGLLLVDVSSSESSAGTIFHKLLFKVEAALDLEFELLKKKVLNLCQNWEIKFN